MADKATQAEFRRQKREQGFAESSIWLSPEEKLLVERKASETGLSKSDVIRQALRKAYSEERA